MTRILECGVLLFCLSIVSAGDLNHLSSTGFSQQSFNLGQYATQNSYANTAYDEQNDNIVQGVGYQMREIGTDQISGGSQREQFDGSAVDLTQNSVNGDDFQSDIFHGGHNFGYDDATQIHDDNYSSSQPAIHAQAETFPISKHVEITRNVPYPVYKQLHIPVQRPVHVPIPHQILIPQSQAYPINIPVAKPYAVPVVQEITIPIQKIVPYPVVKKVPYTVEKHVPYHVEKFITVHKKVPYAVKVPIVKTIIHRVDSHGHYRGNNHGRSYAW